MRYDVWGFPVFKYTDKSVEGMNLNQRIQKYLRMMLSELGIPVEDFTVNKCGNLECKDSCHTHEPQQPRFRFTYFAKYNPETDAKFIFMNPSLSHKIYGDWINTVPAFKPEFTPNILQGDILIYPCFLVHHMADSPSVTLSGNIYKTINKKNVYKE